MDKKRTHWKKLTDTEYFGAYEIMSAGKDIVLTIKNVTEEMIVCSDGKKEKRVVATFFEEYKPMILNVTNLKTIEKDLKYGPFIEEWTGRQIQVYTTKIKAFGSIVDTFRIRPTVPKKNGVYCIECGKEITQTKDKSGNMLSAVKVSEKLNGLCVSCYKKNGGANDTDRK